MSGREPTGWAGAAKLTWEQVQAVRAPAELRGQDYEAMAADWKVHPDTLRRARRGYSWARPYSRRLPEESKPCVICGTVFPRRAPSGRRRIPDHWRRIRTCGPACALTLGRQLYGKGRTRPSEGQPQGGAESP